LQESADKSLLFAGGIGVTPILSMAEHLSETGKDFEMHYCARTKERAAFLTKIETSPFNNQVSLYFDEGPSTSKLNIEEVLRSANDGTHIYVCGPKGFMDFVVNAAHHAGWPQERIHREVFEHESGGDEGNNTFEVVIASSGESYTIPEDKRITEVLADHGVTIETSCTQGVCGTCMTKILEGEPDHRDVYLTEEEQAENDVFLPCCSRSKSPKLVLDL
jgi:vanillate monooxygenase ferredoxin subunit